MPGTIKVEGVERVVAGLKAVDKATKREVRAGIKEAALPVQQRSEELAVSNIRNIGDRWSRMRIGSRGASLAYVAPRARRRGGSPRPNLAPLLKRQMNTALDDSREEVTAKIDAAVATALEVF